MTLRCDLILVTYHIAQHIMLLVEVEEHDILGSACGWWRKLFNGYLKSSFDCAVIVAGRGLPIVYSWSAIAKMVDGWVREVCWKYLNINEFYFRLHCTIERVVLVQIWVAIYLMYRGGHVSIDYWNSGRGRDVYCWVLLIQVLIVTALLKRYIQWGMSLVQICFRF